MMRPMGASREPSAASRILAGASTPALYSGIAVYWMISPALTRRPVAFSKRCIRDELVGFCVNVTRSSGLRPEPPSCFAWRCPRASLYFVPSPCQPGGVTRRLAFVPEPRVEAVRVATNPVACPSGVGRPCLTADCLTKGGANTGRLAVGARGANLGRGAAPRSAVSAALPPISAPLRACGDAFASVAIA